ncbi:MULTISPECIES: ABC transporter ATP-binding protein [unclassified Leucobacter]|uniref:ABC transporter ATP-binding protein n=1 Tax=unclassified Leucobacter TaxID=2621730 RepID=UPI00165D4F87|nr:MULTISPECIES: ABC transporter ATP-binding protein [unclassified Leucobacter]MBC9927004.1 ABC transporter ATP-binding protein [Leucobacter sp. cx-169]MBC9936283.1 ABC transporter ATP-binding protein [Leucobacter sp. cx-87]
MSAPSPKPVPNTPSTRDRLKPLELLGFSGILAIFTALIVLMATRDWKLMLIFGGAAFIISVMMIALIGLGMKPNAQDVEARKDLGTDAGGTDSAGTGVNGH